jgi:hypothetical protein
MIICKAKMLEGIEGKFSEKTEKKIKDIFAAGYVEDVTKKNCNVKDDCLYFALPGDIARLKLDPQTCKLSPYRGIEPYRAQ